MPNYENETCGGCLYWYRKNSTPSNERGTCNRDSQLGTDAWNCCEHFTPSLECRKVRALENTNAHSHVLTKVSMLIAGRMGIDLNDVLPDVTK